MVVRSFGAKCFSKLHISSTILIITDVLIIKWYINNSIVNLYIWYTYFPYFYIILPLLSSNDTHII